MKLKIIGYSGHANSVLSTIKSLGYEITGYYENVENKNNPYNIPFLGNDQEINENHKIDDKYFVCIEIILLDQSFQETFTLKNMI